MSNLIRLIPAAILALALAFSIGFLAGRHSSPPSPISVTVERAVVSTGDVVLRRSGDGQWIEVWRDGELAAEWRQEDGAVFHVLDLIMREEWTLVPGPNPAPIPAPKASTI